MTPPRPRRRGNFAAFAAEDGPGAHFYALDETGSGDELSPPAASPFAVPSPTRTGYWVRRSPTKPREFYFDNTPLDTHQDIDTETIRTKFANVARTKKWLDTALRKEKITITKPELIVGGTALKDWLNRAPLPGRRHHLEDMKASGAGNTFKMSVTNRGSDNSLLGGDKNFTIHKAWVGHVDSPNLQADANAIGRQFCHLLDRCPATFPSSDTAKFTRQLWFVARANAFPATRPQLPVPSTLRESYTMRMPYIDSTSGETAYFSRTWAPATFIGVSPDSIPDVSGSFTFMDVNKNVPAKTKLGSHGQDILAPLIEDPKTVKDPQAHAACQRFACYMTSLLYANVGTPRQFDAIINARRALFGSKMRRKSCSRIVDNKC